MEDSPDLSLVRMRQMIELFARVIEKDHAIPPSKDLPLHGRLEASRILTRTKKVSINAKTPMTSYTRKTPIVSRPSIGPKGQNTSAGASPNLSKTRTKQYGLSNIPDFIPMTLSKKRKTSTSNPTNGDDLTGPNGESTYPGAHLTDGCMS